MIKINVIIPNDASTVQIRRLFRMFLIDIGDIYSKQSHTHNIQLQKRELN